jgi:hypothetical protein
MAGAGQSIHILLVDDERLSRVVVANVLRRCAYQGVCRSQLLPAQSYRSKVWRLSAFPPAAQPPAARFRAPTDLQLRWQKAGHKLWSCCRRSLLIPFTWCSRWAGPQAISAGQDVGRSMRQ